MAEFDPDAYLSRTPDFDPDAYLASKGVKPRQWSDVPGEAVSNIPSSAGRFFGGIAEAVLSPVETAKNLALAAGGGLTNLLGGQPKGELDTRAVNVANAVGQMYKDRYGSAEGIKNTLATDPVGVAADLSTILGGGAALAPKGSMAANVLATGSKYTNPLSIVAPAAKAVAKGGEAVTSNLLGMTTGVGPENIRTAARAGLEGNGAFWRNLTGKEDFGEIVRQARKGVQNMGAEKSAQYRSGMVDIRNDKSILGFGDIDKAVTKAIDDVTYKGQVKNAKGASTAAEIRREVDNWKALDPAEFHTPEGLDALKQKIGGIVESIPYEEKTARMVADNVYRAIKGEINKQAPTYAKVMKDYSEASELIGEIERALSLGPKGKFAADTAIRKLQSLSRNNVNTNYGSRLQLAKELEQKGGVDLMPSIAGQSMNSWVGRGLVGNAGGLATLYGSLHNPAFLAALPFQSPKAVGAAAYGAGRVASPFANAAGRVKLTPQQIEQSLLGLYQAGAISPENERGLLSQ